MNILIERLVLGAAALVIGLGLGWAVRGLVSYNPASENVTAYQDWRVACPPASAKELSCEMQEDVLDGKSGSIVVRVGITSEKGKPELGLTLPLGVALPPGVGLVLGTDKPKVFSFRTCKDVGCIAVMPLDAPTQVALNAAKDGKVLVAGLDGKVVAIPISFKGYSDAISAYHGAEVRRASWVWRLVS
ncbi:MAG TPA: invasion associated locus B family protein [Rhizomicrobium sp.]|jgi:invasion protein IalB|nr:invasion associated locus B family protein [Rhizomicrobium sp.]